MMLRQHREPVEEIALTEGGELLRGLGAVALRDRRDDVFLGAEVAVEAARAHAGLGADFLHRGLMEARAGEASLRCDEDFVTAVGLKLDVGPSHCAPQ